MVRWELMQSSFWNRDSGKYDDFENTVILGVIVFPTIAGLGRRDAK